MITRGSAQEVKSMVKPVAYKKLLGHFKGKSWQIVGFSSDHITLRIERENIRFLRSNGNIVERFKL